ncbi:MAG: hypothetical protein WBF88_17525 [Pusillimonas sp.]
MDQDEIDLQQLAGAMNEAQEPDDELGEDQPTEESENDESDIEQQEEETDEDDESEQSEGDSLDDAAVVKWKTAAGEDFEAPLSELKAGYMRNQDYTQKAQSLANERKNAQEQVAQQFQQVQQYASQFGQLALADMQIQQLEAHIGQMSAQDDPVGYNAATNQLMMAQRQRDGLAARVAQFQQSRTVEQQQAFIAAQQQAAAELASGPNALPDFGPDLVKRMNETGKAYGLTDQELAQITEPKHIRILHDAMKYRDLQAKKPQAVRKAQAAKPARQTRSASPSTIQKAAKSFAVNPSIESMAAMWNAAK